MNNPKGIIIFGANGSGKSALGRELACVLNFKHMDIEDYHFEKSEIPYTIERLPEDRLSLMLADIKKHKSFVLSAVTGDFDEEISTMYDLAVFLSAPLEIRMERIEKRTYEKHGDRVREGGDMYQSNQKFIAFARSRNLSNIDKWAETLKCPLIHLDGTKDYKQTSKDIADHFYTKPDEPWRVCLTDLGELKAYRFVVIFARYQDKWLYCRAKTRDTYETAGGHIDPGETPIEAAKRELYEETGALTFKIKPLFDYSVHRATEFSYGQVYLADIKELGKLPCDFEMSEVKLLDSIPDKMRFPQILPALYEKVRTML